MPRIEHFICPSCRQRTGVDIVYGYPSVALCEMEQRGEIALGGCCMDPHFPDQRCLSCHHEWKIKRRNAMNDFLQ